MFKICGQFDPFVCLSVDLSVFTVSLGLLSVQVDDAKRESVCSSYACVHVRLVYPHAHITLVKCVVSLCVFLHAPRKFFSGITVQTLGWIVHLNFELILCVYFGGTLSVSVWAIRVSTCFFSPQCCVQNKNAAVCVFVRYTVYIYRLFRQTCVCVCVWLTCSGAHLRCMCFTWPFLGDLRCLFFCYLAVL